MENPSESYGESPAMWY